MRDRGWGWGTGSGTFALVAVAGCFLLAACEPQMTNAVNQARTTAKVRRSRSRARSRRPHVPILRPCAPAERCCPPRLRLTAYSEGTDEIHELVGRAPLDPTISDPLQQNMAAANTVWQQWERDPELTTNGWVDQAAGEFACPDGNLYETLVLREPPTMPSSGLYVTPQYSLGSGSVTNGIQYGSAVDVTGATVPLLLDLYLPPSASPSPHPAIVVIHGGAFRRRKPQRLCRRRCPMGGRGFAVIAIDYRLDPNLNGPHTEADQLTAAADAISDAQESVRWLRAHATTYGIDTARIAAAGDSAGRGDRPRTRRRPRPTSVDQPLRRLLGVGGSRRIHRGLPHSRPGGRCTSAHWPRSANPHVPLRDRRCQRSGNLRLRDLHRLPPGGRHL